MRRLVTRLRDLFSGNDGGDDDLAGAVDLSDSAYCFDLLGKHGDDATSCPQAPNGE